MQLAQKNIWIQKIVAGVSILLLVVKIGAYYLTNSVAILTDAMEGIVNIIAGFVGLYSLYLSAKPRDEDHPYGHGKIEFISAALEGSMILVAGAIIFYHAIKNLFYPAEMQQLDVGMILICITAIINFFVGAICLRAGKRSDSIALIASGKHLQSDAYTTIGIVAGLIIVFFTKVIWLDSVIAIIVAVIIVRTGYKIIRTSIAGIMDESDRELLVKMVGMLNNHRHYNWVDLHNVRIIKYGNVLHIDCHLTVPWFLNVHEAHREIDELTGLVRARFGRTIEFFVHTDGCLPFQCRLCDKGDCAVRHHAFEKKIEWTVENISSDQKHRLD
ncbi:cation diffusion facilitator family transporter [Pseudochryseolinea flava]|uniref:Cation diffusion facilitator family transporter n=1 Tax=Pseudochryseolinea flava TaxID=2059302 RepID=A0A364XYZ5_9BACT|nr:cation diffusion facilitator family transporter [Pseudochryseolinea flava]RAV98815.1 cation diffusion facilitator family transporter [Pseudochryseolinea flava]